MGKLIVSGGHRGMMRDESKVDRKDCKENRNSLCLGDEG